MARTKKLVTFANEELISKMTKEFAQIENNIESGILEEAVLATYLTTNKHINWLIRALYSEGPNSGVNYCLKKLYSTNSGGVNWGVFYTDILDFVLFSCKFIQKNDCIIDRNQEAYDYCQKLVERICDIFNISDDLNNYFYVSELFMFFSSNWDKIGGHTYTHRALAAVHDLIIDPIETKEERYELRKMIINHNFAFSVERLNEISRKS